MRKKVIIIISIILLIGIAIYFDFPFMFMDMTGPDSIETRELGTIGTLKTINGFLHTWKKKGYTVFGRRYPNALPDQDGKGSVNAGKYCGLYYQKKDNQYELTLIGRAEAHADFRADGDTDFKEEKGWYQSCHWDDSFENILYNEKIEFNLKPKRGYWYGLMDYYSDDDKKLPYNLEYARDHYAMIAIPAVYGESGVNTFIINEAGAVYKKDLGKSEYLDTFPGPDPTKHGWILCE